MAKKAQKETQVKSTSIDLTFFGNKALYDRLISAVAGGRLCHAYLFYGKKGIGKRTLAKRLAAAILCKADSSVVNIPCLECKSCRKLLTENHPDFYCYDEKEGRNTFHIDTIRTLRQDAYILPNESDYKVYLLPNAQDMSIGAVNAFLKILEEPPKHTIFILTATSKTAVLSTILSRCIPFEVFPLSDDEFKKVITERHPDCSVEQLERICLLSQGALGRAEELILRADLEDSAELTRRMAEAIRRGRRYDLLSALHDGNTSRVAMLELLTELSIFLRGALLYKLSTAVSTDPLIIGLAQRLSVASLTEKLETLSNVRREIEGNVNMSLFIAMLTEKLV